MKIFFCNRHLVINYEIKPDLSATLDYMDNGEWLMTYNPFVEYDPYVFIKE
jgi:hypothetical protein